MYARFVCSFVYTHKQGNNLCPNKTADQKDCEERNSDRVPERIKRHKQFGRVAWVWAPLNGGLTGVGGVGVLREPGPGAELGAAPSAFCPLS